MVTDATLDTGGDVSVAGHLYQRLSCVRGRRITRQPNVNTPIPVAYERTRYRAETNLVGGLKSGIAKRTIIRRWLLQNKY